MTSPLEEKIKSTLGNSVDDLDTATLHRLQAIRREALNQAIPTSFWSSFKIWLPASGFALCSIMAAMLWLPQFNAPNSIAPFEQTAMLELIESPDEFEALSDPGFYLWLDELDEQHV